MARPYENGPERNLTIVPKLAGGKAFFLHPLERRGGAGIGLLQVHTPIAQRLERNLGARDSADDISPRRQHPILAVKILQNCGAAADIAFELVHGGIVAPEPLKNQAASEQIALRLFPL